VARLNRQKGLMDLVQVAVETAASEPDWRFVIIGEGEMRAELEAAIAASGLRRRVTLLGRQPAMELARWLGAADVLALPSHFEGLPATLLEALACGCPVVATAVGGVPDLGIPPELGALVPPAQPPALAGALDRVLRGVRRPLPEEARRRLLAPYEPARVVDAVVGLYAEAMGR